MHKAVRGSFWCQHKEKKARVHNSLIEFPITWKNSYSRIQGAGLGGMKPNTVILGWPNSWRKREEESWRVFVDTIRNTAAAKMALLVPKGQCLDSSKNEIRFFSVQVFKDILTLGTRFVEILTFGGLFMTEDF